jgi:hypothetical protein
MAAGQVLTLNDVLTIDDMAVGIANNWYEWNSARQEKITQWEEVRKYKYAVDTTTTTNNSLPWKNKTTYPKLTQISDNLWANYIKSLFPKRRWLIWEGYDETSEDKAKKEAIEEYMMYVVDRSGYQKTVGELLDDWIQYGNCFSTVEWVDDRIQLEDRMQVGYVGPRLVRISPLDIVFNPIAPSFEASPKIVRKFVTLGDLREEISRLSASEEKAQELWDYLREIRSTNTAAGLSEIQSEDMFLQIDGFRDFRSYLGSDYAEVLTFYGDLFVRETGDFYRNHVITIVDRHKVISVEPNPSYFGKAPIFHCGWRTRQDNLWAMGPLDNIVGMQYRIDHLENLKADVFDLNAFPPLKIKGYMDDFTWAPMEKIYVGDDGDVEMIAPHFEILNANLEIQQLEQKMEQIVGAPKEAMGIRSPGEKTAYEVQRLENASGRIFISRLEHIEDQQVEPSLSAMLELARRKLTSQELRIYDDELKIASFMTLTPQDITGNGRLRPVAAKHFAEQAERVQNVTQFLGSPVGMDPLVNVHISGLQTAQMFEDLLDLHGYKLVTPFVRVAEQAEIQNLSHSAQEQSAMQAGTPRGLTPDDASPEVVGNPPPGLGK